jgi:hypothetical protein
MDLPIKQFQDIKTHLQRKKNLNIQEALVLKCLGIDVLHEHFVEKYFFDARSYLDNIFSLKFQDLLDFIVVLFPSDFNDTSFIILFTPHDFGFVKNEAYTGNDILFTWFSVFKSFDLDLASNCVSNLYIKARYWSAVDQFFPECKNIELFGNILCNPPYPINYLSALFTNVGRNIKRIHNMLIILPTLSVDNGNIVKFFTREFSSYCCLESLNRNFSQKVKIKRFASRMQFTLLYIGKNVIKFQDAFCHFSQSKRPRNEILPSETSSSVDFLE